MDNLDFFAEYKGYKRRTDRIFESLDKKANSNKVELDEAFFGLVQTAKDKENELKDYFFKLLKAPNWQNYKIDIGGTEVEISKATPEQIEKAWEAIRAQGLNDSFTGLIKQDGDSIIYQKGKGKSMKDAQQADDQDQVQDQTQDQDASQLQPTAPTYEITYDKKSGKYFFGSQERYVEKISNSITDLETYDWKRSPLKYLFEDPLKFGLREIVFDFKEEVIASARDGFWIGDFSGKFLQAAFIGNSFRGQFFNNNEEWKSEPTAFISGTFSDRSKTGLLGLDDVKQGNESSSFHLIQLPVNYSIEILTDKQLRHTITCEKRLDISNSNFIYSVYMGYDIEQGSPNRVTLPWEVIRENYNAYNINKKISALPDLFSLNSNEKIIELRVVESGTPPVFKFKEKFDVKKKYSEEVVNLRGLKQISANIPAKDLKFNITSQSELENFNKIKGYINSLQFANDLKKASVYLDNRLISSSDIKTNFPYLVNVFTQDVISEAAVGFGNAKKSYGRKSFASTSNVKNPLTNKAFEGPYEISDYLNKKYEKEIAANGGRKTKAYQKEYEELYNSAFGVKKVSASVEQLAKASSDNPKLEKAPIEVGGVSKDEEAVLKRIENFVKYFVYKIDNGNSTNKIRKYFIDLLKSKITAHKDVVKASTPTKQVPIKKQNVPKPDEGPMMKGLGESLVRDKIRKILNDLL